jgi:chromosome segregation ATPase
MNESIHDLKQLTKNIDDIKHLLQSMSEMIGNTNEKIDSLERKIDKLTTRMDEEILSECKKMGSHINFVEAVYENVKHPLGYICNKFNYLTHNVVEQQYVVTDVNGTDE